MEAMNGRNMYVDKQKIISEKPLSLDPLDFEEALLDLFAARVPKEPKEKEAQLSGTALLCFDYRPSPH